VPPERLVSGNFRPGNLKNPRGHAEEMGLVASAPVLIDDQTDWIPEPGWARADFESLSVDEATMILLRRMRKLLARGLEPLDALRLASKLDAPLF
jgi:hypothetical protein